MTLYKRNSRKSYKEEQISLKEKSKERPHLQTEERPAKLDVEKRPPRESINRMSIKDRTLKRNSTTSAPKVEKFDMKMFLKSVSNNPPSNLGAKVLFPP